MKRFTSFLIALFAVVCSFSAAADDVNFKLVVDNPEGVNCSISGVTKELVQGDNSFSVPNYTQVVLESVAPYTIASVTDATGEPRDVDGGTCYLFLMTQNDGEVFTVTTINLDTQRDSECTVIVDDPTLVSASLSGFGQTVTLTEGANTVKFMEGKEENLIIASTNWRKPIFEVKLGDEVVKRNNTTKGFSVPLTNGCVVTITAVIPDKDITVTFDYTTEDAVGAIASVKVDGTAVPEFDGKTVSMKAGQSFEFASNPDYNIEEVKVNDDKISFWGTYSNDCVLEDMKVSVTAHPYGTIKYTVDVDDPENVIFYRGFSYKNDVITLVAGENHLEISEGAPYVCWAPAEGCFIESALVNGAPLPYGSGCDMKEGTVVKITTGKIVLDKTAVVWFDNKDAVSYSTLRCGDENVETENGYNVIPYWTQMVPFSLSFTVNSGVTLVNKVYLDGVLLTPFYSSDSYASYNTINVEDKSVVKAFISTEPVKCNVTFDAPEGLEATVTYDRVKTLDKLADGLACFKGTEVAIEGPEDLTVKVGETELEKNDDNKFVFTVSNPATTVTLADKSSGVESVVISAEADANTAVYNLMGVRVGTRADLSTLPAGIYVLNGQKVIVK